MADRQFTWEAIIDNKGAIRSINELTDTLKRAFQQSGTKVELIDRASVEAAKASIRSATTEQVESQKRATIEARTQSSERVQLARNESALVAEAAKAASATKIEEERRTTALLRAELQERQRAISQSAPQNNQASGNGLQNAVLGGIAGYFTVQGAQQIFNYAKEIAALDTSVSRASKAFEIMSGSANEAEKRLRAIQSASGGTVTEFQAIQIANQATSLGLAKSSGEFEKLTRAARAVTFVSPVIRDVQSAISELALASSNLSFRRLDQLGLSVTEVKTRMSELKAANSGLDDSQAFLAASVDALNSKFGALLNSTEAQAGGVERLTTAWENFKAAIATGNIGEMINKELTDAAFAIEKFQAFLTGDTSKLGTADKLDFLIAGKKTQLTGASDGGAEYQAQIADLERLKTLLDEVDRLSAAGVPGLDSFTERLRIMAGESVAAGHVTEDAAASMGYLQAALASAEGALDSTTRAGTYYAKAVEIAGAETINTDERTSALLGRMVNLTIQYDMGAISAAEYTAYVGELGSQLIDVAEQAATAANEVGRLNNEIRGGGGYANPQKGKYNRVDTGATYKPEIFDTIGVRQKNQEAYDNLSSSDHGTKDDARVRSLNTSRANAKELEVAARKAASAGTKAFNTAAKEMNSMITGIVKVSEVTQQDIEDAKNGTYKEKPDEYLRQLRDEVKNKKDYKDVSIEDAAAGLNKIGVETAGKSAEAVLQLFEQAYSNMSLFADESNLKFINDAAVQYQIDLQEKSKLGQENIVRHFGGIVDGAVSAIVGGGGGGASTGVAGGVAATGAAPAINIDGQALAGNNLDIKATVTGLEIGADVDTDLSDKFSFKLTINQQSIVLTADDAQLIKDRIAGQITPKLTFNQQSIVFTPMMRR